MHSHLYWLGGITQAYTPIQPSQAVLLRNGTLLWEIGSPVISDFFYKRLWVCTTFPQAEVIPPLGVFGTVQRTVNLIYSSPQTPQHEPEIFPTWRNVAVCPSTFCIFSKRSAYKLNLFRSYIICIINNLLRRCTTMTTVCARPTVFMTQCCIIERNFAANTVLRRASTFFDCGTRR